MRMKQVTAATIQDALALARQELGADAVLLDSKKNEKGKGVVVTFAVEENDDDLWSIEPALAAPKRPAPKTAPRTKSNPPPIEEETLSRAHDRLERVKPGEPEHAAIALIADAVRYHGIPLAFAERLMARVYKVRLKPDQVIETAEAALAEALDALVVFKPIATAAPRPPARAIMLVGPHGAGKTSSISKLATELTLNKQPLVLISSDLERLGGADSLQQLAEILKCPFHLGDSRAALKSLLAEHQGKSWVLVDSSGTNIYEFTQLKALGELAGLQGIEPVLTCPAGIDTAEAQEMASVFNFLSIERMIITRMDAVRRLGSIFAAQSTGGYALCNYASSAILTDACTPISAAALARFMLRHVRERTSH